MNILALALCLVVCATGFVFASPGDVTMLDDHHVVPKVLLDAKTKIIYYLESDGRHVSAISPDGKVLWSRDPFVDKKLGPYRTPWPIICSFDFVDPAWWKLHSWLGPEDDFIGVNFNSSQFGVINKKTGDFTGLGQD